MNNVYWSFIAFAFAVVLLVVGIAADVPALIWISVPVWFASVALFFGGFAGRFGSAKQTTNVVVQQGSSGTPQSASVQTEDSEPADEEVPPPAKPS